MECQKNKLVCDASSTEVDNNDLAASSTEDDNMAPANSTLSWFGLGQHDQCGYWKDQTTQQVREVDV
jgi:hypothetical protein